MNDIKREIIEKYMQENNKTTLDIEDVLYLLEENATLQHQVYCEYMHDIHLMEISNEIDFINEDRETPLFVDDETRHAILEDYENILDNSEDWHDCLMDAIERNVDLEEKGGTTMQATREDFDMFLKSVKRIINDKDMNGTCFFDFKDYSEFIQELREFLDKNSEYKWEITTTHGIGIQKV